MKKSNNSEKSLRGIVERVNPLCEDSFQFVWDKISTEHHNIDTMTNPYDVVRSEKA